MTEVRGEAQQRSDGRCCIVGSQEVTALAGLLRLLFFQVGWEAAAVICFTRELEAFFGCHSPSACLPVC